MREVRASNFVEQRLIGTPGSCPRERIAMTLMLPLDSMFLLMESREHPMHVGGLSLFVPPEGDDGEFARSLYRSLTDVDSIRPLFRRKPVQFLSNFAPVRWTEDTDVDLEYHVRLLALPKPGRVRELLELTSMLHGTLLDRHRPLWEAYVIEGLADGRVAVYMKTHHALMDGVSAVQAWYRSLSSDPLDRESMPPWAQRPSSGRVRASRGLDLQRRVGSVIESVQDVVGVGPAIVNAAASAVKDHVAPLPFAAPKSIFNVPITGARRVAAQSWPIERLRKVSCVADVTLNDAVLAMCAGALRRYLIELDELPDKPLIAMVPVSLRKGTEGEASGNAVGAVLCDLATELADPAARLQRVHDSMSSAKSLMSGLTPLQITALSALNVAGLGLPLIPGSSRLITGRPVFNLVISNVPGPTTTRYWNGAKLESCYPASIPLDGQAMNITVIGYADTMQFGLVGCRRNVPHLQRLLGHLEESLSELEAAAG